MMNKFDDSRFFDAKRLKDLGDGIFAFSMTFLIVTIGIPKVPFEFINDALIKMIPDILTYVLSFFLLAIFWMTNHIQMKNIKRADSRVVWINILLFLFIVFVPLTTDLYAFYDGSQITMLIFNLNILLISLAFTLQWHHLVANSLHHDEFTQVEINDRYVLCQSFILIALIAIAVGLFSPVLSAMVYLLLGLYRIYLRLKWVQLQQV
ncbi:MAG: TMEM175 family protein [Candidatus Margulisiibacteriota bacterium]